MNYRHAYHAGNFADVFKHLILVEIITYLKRKPAPFRVIDTHAGVGAYALASTEAKRTGEWLDGIARLRAAWLSGDAVSSALQKQTAHLRQALETAEARLKVTDVGTVYPGSPVLAAALLREQDRLIANELHPEDNAQLKSALRGFRNAKVLQIDAYTALRSLMPPPERRGLVLVDPPFEQPGEFDRMAAGLDAALKRFRTGIYALWYPIKDVAPLARFKSALSAIKTCELIAAELHLRAPDDPNDLSGCGLIIANPPYPLAGFIEGVGPVLAAVLSKCDARRVVVEPLNHGF